MLSAPASIPATTHAVLITRFGESTPRCSPANSWRPAEAANLITGTRPAADTRFGSSKTGVIL